MIHSLIINDFRCFKDKSIRLGKYITAISGKNGIGKSTILALLGNSCEIKGKEGKTIFHTQFRTEFSEIFKASKEFDKSGSDKCRIRFSDIKNPSEINDIKICRVTWQKQRFRLIPESKAPDNKNSRKKKYPSVYLGLSRLYPIGEAKDEGIKVNKVKLDEYEKKHFLDNYMNILNLYEEGEIGLDIIDIDETNRKCGVGIATSKYSSITNSAGQDNLGQIIFTVLSFRRLKETLKDEYEGGLLLIDEIDATLHPVAQCKLVKYLYDQCRELNLQVVFTTHSVSLLEYLSLKTFHNKDNQINNYEIVYLTKSNGPLIVLENPPFSVMCNDLKLTEVSNNLRNVTVYSEDDEARWFIEKLLDRYNIYINPVNIKLGCSELLRLNNSDPLYFSNVLFIVDGDVAEKDIVKSSNNVANNVIKLPGKVRPEQVIYEYLLTSDENNDYWARGFGLGFTKENLREYGPTSGKYKGKDRERYKQWFKENRGILESLDIITWWKNDNKEEYEKFMGEFIYHYNEIAKRKFYPLINN